MNSDFRITTDALDHPKLVKLKRLTGDAGLISLFRLWGFTARYHPKGDLNELTDEDIEIASQWDGVPGAFFSALIKLRLIDETLGRYSIHDWEEHNGYAFHAPERVEKARNAARIRWESPMNTRNNATGNATSNAHSNAPSPNPNPKTAHPRVSLNKRTAFPPSKCDKGYHKPDLADPSVIDTTSICHGLNPDINPNPHRKKKPKQK